ncbi:hypothetical protein GCM10010495_33220 [Kitasatospora herbaricolor]|nr:hypothetical protein GCM10010495_33220 [Kitasatospora herbaricolor]
MRHELVLPDAPGSSSGAFVSLSERTATGCGYPLAVRDFDLPGVPRHTFVAQFGAVVAGGRGHRETFQVLRPGFDLSEERAKRATAGNRTVRVLRTRTAGVGPYRGTSGSARTGRLRLDSDQAGAMWELVSGCAGRCRVR